MNVLPQATEKIVCHCLGVTESEIVTAVSIHGSPTVKAVMDCTRAGTGCTACHRRIAALLSRAETSASEPVGSR